MGSKRLPMRAHPCYGEDGKANGGVVLHHASDMLTLWLTPPATKALRGWLKKGPPWPLLTDPNPLLAGHTRWRYEPRWVQPPMNEGEARRRRRSEAGTFHIEVGPRERSRGAVHIRVPMGADRLLRVIDAALAEGRRESRS